MIARRFAALLFMLYLVSSAAGLGQERETQDQHPVHGFLLASSTFPYCAAWQFQVALNLMGKNLEQVVELPYKTVVDNSLLDEIARSGSSC